MGSLALHTGSLTVHWEENTSYISVVEYEIVTPIVKHIEIPVCFLQEKLTMFSLFQNMISIVSFRNICVPNHFQVQLSIRLING